MTYIEKFNYFQWIGISWIINRERKYLINGVWYLITNWTLISIVPKVMSLEYLLKINSDKKSDTIYSMSSTAAA